MNHYKRLDLPPVRKRTVKLVSSCKTKIEQLGEVTVSLVFNKDKEYKLHVSLLLSLKTSAEEMELEQRVDKVYPKPLIAVPKVPHTFQDTRGFKPEDIFEQYKGLFDGLGCLPNEHKIKYLLQPVTSKD